MKNEIKANPGDTATIRTEKEIIKGKIIESYDEDVLLVKLDSG